jgi:hypothetical protein
MKMKAVSSVFIALFLVILTFGTLFSLLYLMQYPSIPQTQPPLALKVSYNVTTGYFNITNVGGSIIHVQNIFIREPDGNTYVSTFQASILQGQTIPIFLGKYLEQGSVVSIETSEGVKTVVVS